MAPLPKSQSWPNQRWRWLFPIVLTLFFLAILFWLPWQAQRMEANERQEQLIADTLWVEQAIMFQLDRNAEQLSQLREALQQDPLRSETLSERGRALLHTAREIQRLEIFDARRHLYLSFPETDLAPHTLPPHLSEGLHCSATAATLRCLMLLDAAHPQSGYLALHYSLQGILDELVPWWFAQDNQIQILDADDHVLAARQAGGSGRHVYTHRHPLEIGGQSFMLRTDSIKPAPRLLSNLLVASVVVLACALIWSLIALWRDITRRLAAEGALRQQALFRAAMENSLITGLRARDMTGRLTYVNPAFCRLVGFSADELIGRAPPMPYWAPEALQAYQARLSNILAGHVPAQGFETIYLHASGRRIPVLVHESPLVNEKGTQTGWMSSILDLSELKHAQELARQQEARLHSANRLATMGEMASMLAHELNQPLSAISSYTAGALNLLNAPQEPARGRLQEALEKAHAQAQRAGQIIRSVHEFVKKRDPSRNQVHLEELIRSIVPLIELQAHALHVRIDLLIPALPPVLADRTLIEQVILNLTRNAIEAMQEIALPQRVLTLACHSETGTARVWVEVRDRGHGISDDMAANLFSPFFSTKTHGMGMGLNICRTAIEFHGGHLDFRPNPGGGTIFVFALPVATPLPASLTDQKE